MCDFVHNPLSEVFNSIQYHTHGTWVFELTKTVKKSFVKKEIEEILYSRDFDDGGKNIIKHKIS
jgi:hypothetical protein